MTQRPEILLLVAAVFVLMKNLNSLDAHQRKNAWTHCGAVSEAYTAVKMNG